MRQSWLIIAATVFFVACFAAGMYVGMHGGVDNDLLDLFFLHILLHH